jgi:hypothetical protein
MSVREDFLTVAGRAADLLREPAVAEHWARPSALPEFSVAGLAGHLAYQVLVVPSVLAAPRPCEPTVPLLGHYEQASWVGAELDADINVRIRRGGEQLAARAEGPAALAEQVAAAVVELTGSLPADLERPVRMTIWGPWSLRLEDLLVTRMMELAVHSDDLAVSVELPTPVLPPSAVQTVIDLLSRLAVRRHGAASVLRALSRAERAPENIAAI